MDWFRIVRDFFEQGIYTADQVNVFVVQGKISAEQAKEIIGS